MADNVGAVVVGVAVDIGADILSHTNYNGAVVVGAPTTTVPTSCHTNTTVPLSSWCGQLCRCRHPCGTPTTTAPTSSWCDYNGTDVLGVVNYNGTDIGVAVGVVNYNGAVVVGVATGYGAVVVGAATGYRCRCSWCTPTTVPL